MSQNDRTTGLVGNAAFKVPCRAATTANITLSGEQTIDGVACVDGDRVLVKNQTLQQDNGIYVVDTGAWDRAKDFDGVHDVVKGTLVMVIAGATNINTYWRCTTADTVDIDTDNITFDQALLSDAALASFLQAGTGAVARTAQAKMRETVSVLDFGAVGDGVADDTAAFAAAIASGHKRIYVPAGTYICNVVDLRAASQANDGIVLIGESVTSTIIKGTASTTSLLRVGHTAGGYQLNTTLSDFTLDITNVPDIGTNSALYMRKTYDNSVTRIKVIGNGTNKLSLDLQTGTYTTLFTSCDFGTLTGKLSLVGLVGDRVTTITFISCTFAKCTADYVLSITFLQPVAQGDSDKFVLSNTLNFTVLGGDMEATTPGSYYMYNFGSGVTHVTSIGNELTNLSYRTGSFAQPCILMDNLSANTSLPRAMTADGVTATLAQNATETIFTAGEGSVHLIVVPRETGGNGAWRGTFVVSYDVATGAHITTLNANVVDCVASGAGIQLKNLSVSSVALEWAYVRLK